MKPLPKTPNTESMFATIRANRMHAPKCAQYWKNVPH